MKQFIKKLIRSIFNKPVRKFYNKQYNSLLKRNNLPNNPCEGEDKWIKRWSVLGKVSPVYFRLFSNYIGNDINIIPEDICRNTIEPILNPIRYTSYYADKNMFDKLFGHNIMPQTIFRKMYGFYYDSNYKCIHIYNSQELNQILSVSGCKKIVIKPTVDSSSGNDVRLFEKIGDKWIEVGGNIELCIDFLDKYYNDNFIVQECLEQADFMSYYNPTSVNTLRLTLYRSVKTDECHIPSAIMRIGKNGSLVDNAHAGGGYIGIKSDGTLCNNVLNQHGETTTEFNGIDFTKEHKIPNWNKVVEFAKYIGRNIPHHRLLALDIMVDKDGNYRLIEFNCKAYSMWLFQFTVGAALGEYTDEIIEYCKNNINKAEKWIKI